MDSSKQLLVAGTVSVVIAGITGIVVTSQPPTSAKPPAQRTVAVPVPSDKLASAADEKDKEWKGRLTEEQFLVARKKATEPAFSGKYWNHKGHGVYTCVCCKTPLFASSTKFDSGTGWPSFYQPIGEKAVDTEVDSSLITQRTEVLCRKCQAHLGHVFEDGPPPTGLRYCINSASLDFQEGGSTPKTGGE